ncbi:MAG: efflux RND transporter permease subunit [Acidobacteriota bacterium]
MLERFIEATLKHTGMVMLSALVIVAGGIYAFMRLPIDAFPDVTNIQVEITSRADGLSAVEIERSITHPIEMAMRGLPGVTQMRSVTRFGLSLVTIVFDDKTDPYFARQLIFERLAEAKEQVPEGVSIEMGPVATVMGEIYQYTLEGRMPADAASKKAYLTRLRTLEEWVVSPLLKNVPGVNEVNSFGGYFRQYQVIASPSKLLQYDLTAEDVYEAIGKNNRNVGGSVIERFSEQSIVRGVGLIKDTDDLGAIVLKSVSGTPVLVRDVAEIRVGEAVRQGAAMINGKEETVGGIVMMLRGENGREVVTRVKEKVREINESGVLPEGIRIVPFYDRTDIVNASIWTVTRALIEGSILVLIVLYLLLRSVRGSAVVLLALPLSLFATFIVMKLTGVSANLMSLGGLAISIGMIIDATIIQVENVQRRLDEAPHAGRPAIAIVLKAVLEVRKPSIFGELIIAITFIPILSLEGIEGKMFGPLALTVAIALLSSLALSIVVIPSLCALVLRPQKEKESAIMAFLARRYRPLLEYSMKNNKKLIGGAALALALSLALIPQLGTEFIPVMDEGSFDMDVSLLPGVSLERAMELNQLVGRKLGEFPELRTVVSRTGQTGIALDTRGVDKTGYVGVFYPKKEWKRTVSREELTAKMRESLSTIPGIAFSFSQPIQCRIDELVAGTKAQLIVKLFGSDMELLGQKADEIARVLGRIEGATDLQTEKISGQPYLTIDIDRAKIARYGLNISDVQHVIEIAIAGKTASKLYEEDKSFDIVVRLPEEKRNSIESISDILVSAPGGARIPLGQIASISQTEGPAQISREDGARRIGIELNIEGRDIGGFVAEAKQKIRERVLLPPGYYLTWGGQFENQERAMARLLVIGPAAILAILLLLFVTFRSWRLALLVISNLPFALIGGIVSLWIAGLYLSVPASVGFIVLFGVAVLNGVVLVSHIAQLREEHGMELSQAIVQGSMDRLRPVLMTASIAIFSLIPMLTAGGPGSEIQKPLAAVVVGGLVTSTALTLLLIPSMYALFEGSRGRKKSESLAE